MDETNGGKSEEMRNEMLETRWINDTVHARRIANEWQTQIGYIFYISVHRERESDGSVAHALNDEKTSLKNWLIHLSVCLIPIVCESAHLSFAILICALRFASQIQILSVNPIPSHRSIHSGWSPNPRHGKHEWSGTNAKWFEFAVEWNVLFWRKIHSLPRQNP